MANFNGTSADDIVNLVNASNNNVNAGEGNNSITTGNGRDNINTGSGDDTIDAGDGDNNVNAGEGKNTITTGSGRDNINTGSGDDTINADNGNNNVNAGEGKNTITTGSGRDNVNTGSGDDTINAGDGENYINAGEGRNVVTTGAGNDHINTGSNSDRINAGGGSDRINTGGGEDTIVAVDASAENAGAGEVDYVSGGGGADLFVLGDESQVYYVDGSGSNGYAVLNDFNKDEGDQIQLNGTADDYVLKSTQGSPAWGLGLYLKQADGSEELIGILQGNTHGLTLDHSAFKFVAPTPPPADGADSGSGNSSDPNGYRIFQRDLVAEQFTVDIANDQPVYQIGGANASTLNIFLGEAAQNLGGTVLRNGEINPGALEHFGGNQDPSIQIRNGNEVRIGGSGVGGQFRVGFNSSSDAVAFKEFADDLLGKDPANTKIFQFKGGTNGGANTIEIAINGEVVALNPDQARGLGTPDSLDFSWRGADAGAGTAENLDEFVEAMGALFGGTQALKRNGAPFDGNVRGFGNQTQARLVGDDLNKVDLGSRGVGGKEVWQFDDQQDAQNFLSFFQGVFAEL